MLTEREKCAFILGFLKCTAEGLLEDYLKVFPYADLQTALSNVATRIAYITLLMEKKIFREPINEFFMNELYDFLKNLVEYYPE